MDEPSQRVPDGNERKSRRRRRRAGQVRTGSQQRPDPEQTFSGWGAHHQRNLRVHRSAAARLARPRRRDPDDKFRQGTPVTTDAVGLVLVTIDRIKQLLAELEGPRGRRAGGIRRGSHQPPRGDGRRFRAGADADPRRPAARAGGAEGDVGTLSNQTLERELKPGEVPLDELERVFRETAVEAPVAPKAPAARGRPCPWRGGGRRACVGADHPRQCRHPRTPDDDGLGAGADPQPAHGDRAPPGRERYKVSLQRLSTVTCRIAGSG